jgi:hypothetical protein
MGVGPLETGGPLEANGQTLDARCPKSALYVGTVRHRRFKPKAHAFAFPLFLAFLDIDRLPELCGVSRFISLNRWNWASFDDRDHLGDAALPLRERLRRDAQAKGHALPAGPVFLLCHLRYFGYCFNPVSYFYCYDADGRLALLCAEVMNTPWKERHTYWMDPAQGHATELGLSFEVPKAFHVSPFMPMDCRYRWAFTEPGGSLKIHIAEFQGEDFFFDVDLGMDRREWSARQLHRTLMRFPWVTLKVIAAIHWEALWLWIKRVPVYTHPKKQKV